MSGPVEQIDIAPTLAALAGVSPPASWEGQSLLPLWNDDRTAADAPSRTVFTMNFEENSSAAALSTGALAVVQGSWKLIHYLGSLHYAHMPLLQDELYDLQSDPGETNNRAADSIAERERLGDLAAAELRRYGGSWSGASSTAR
jgi:arylsulfatase A-like enzyme